jgi:hypothetical protein
MNNCSTCCLDAAYTPSPSPSHCANPRPCSGSAEETMISSGTSVRNPSAAKPSERGHSSISRLRRHPRPAGERLNDWCSRPTQGSSACLSTTTVQTPAARGRDAGVPG